MTVITPDGLVERHVPFTGDGTATTAALCAGSDEPHVLYENQGAVSWAEGELAVVTVRSDGVTFAGQGVRGEHDGGAGTAAHPLAVAGHALDVLARGNWRAYGWVGFELAHARNGSRAVPPTGEPPVLARFTLPRLEIRIDGRTALLRACDSRELDALERRMVAAAGGLAGPGVRHPETGAARVPVDLAGHGAARYRSAVRRAVREIRAGRLDKVILSRAVPVSGEIDLAATYLTGRRAHEPARSFLLRQGGWEAAGFSPEIVVRVGGDGTARTQPLAGTRALEGDRNADLALRAELYRDAKEVYEHAISVRLAQDELGTVCAPGTVSTGDFMSVKERGSVQHLASELSGRLRPGATCWDALDALFPAVTASGIPKDAACALIRRTEPEPRGLYSGTVLTVGADGSMDAALVLRSVFRREGRTWLRAGAGIVAQSDPERELEETREKLRAIGEHLVPAAAGPVPEAEHAGRAAS
ncbi:salicylate synthase [Streptomyces albiaxialis]|uniref:Salicylate synthase n=1 Tax=Streptomyces albiaxialis TaxID=329523 RepID=A0ABN2VQI9_9ACTN